MLEKDETDPQQRETVGVRNTSYRADCDNATDRSILFHLCFWSPKACTVPGTTTYVSQEGEEHEYETKIRALLDHVIHGANCIVNAGECAVQKRQQVLITPQAELYRLRAPAVRLVCGYLVPGVRPSHLPALN